MCAESALLSSREECSAALEELGRCHDAVWSGESSVLPGACSYRPDYCGTHDMHWNTLDGVGAGRSDLAPICLCGATPTDAPTEQPTEVPTDAPTAEPTDSPTEAPTDAPTAEPTDSPTEAPTDAPTAEPTDTTTESQLVRTYIYIYLSELSFGVQRVSLHQNPTPLAGAL